MPPNILAILYVSAACGGTVVQRRSSPNLSPIDSTHLPSKVSIIFLPSNFYKITWPSRHCIVQRADPVLPCTLRPT